MTDAETRQLERQASHDPRASLALARAHERRGEPALALETLWAGCGDLAVRRVASQFETDRGPIRSTRVLWRVPVERDDRIFTLTATPLALIVGSSQRTILLDPRTGATRADVPQGNARLVSEAVILDDTALDAWTGERLSLFRVPGRRLRAVGADLLVTFARGHVLAFRFQNPRQPPEFAWRWKGDLGPFDHGEIADGLVVLTWCVPASARQCRDTFVALDARDGSERFRVSFDVRRGDLEGLPRDRWSRVSVGHMPQLHRVTPDTVVLRRLASEARVQLDALDQDSGQRTGTRYVPLEELQSLEDVRFHVWQSGGVDALLEAFRDLREDTIPRRRGGRGRGLAVEPPLVFASTPDRQLWAWRPTRMPTHVPRPELALLPGRLFVYTGDEVVCLVADESGTRDEQ